MALIKTAFRCAPGHASCKPTSVPTQDGPSRYFKFRLLPIRKDFWNVLCFANANCLRSTAMGIIQEAREFANQQTPANVQVPQTPDSNLMLSISNKETSRRFQGTQRSRGFWIVFSKRFKASLPILSVSDVALVLRALDICDKDTGEFDTLAICDFTSHFGCWRLLFYQCSIGVYVDAVMSLRNRIHEFDKDTLVTTLGVLSNRLRQNTQKEFFQSLANHVPNVLYSMSGKSSFWIFPIPAREIVLVLWYLNRAGYASLDICRFVHAKFINMHKQLNDFGEK
ncbi:hypothetical protein BdWA1_000941 [Babesia duncani]|uniref:Uncharacterized protein n=1 Tax=Babesia duncani TaxID=323732 RepID=A0AAD9PP43_9APIC|nr:hypothetical protein BdWA1_000941 [Babesia duncani]